MDFHEKRALKNLKMEKTGTVNRPHSPKRGDGL